MDPSFAKYFTNEVINHLENRYELLDRIKKKFNLVNCHGGCGDLADPRWDEDCYNCQKKICNNCNDKYCLYSLCNECIKVCIFHKAEIEKQCEYCGVGYCRDCVEENTVCTYSDCLCDKKIFNCRDPFKGWTQTWLNKHSSICFH